MNRALSGICGCIMIVVTGCASQVPRVELTTYDAAGRPERSFAHFNRTGYRTSAGGLLEVVMEAESPSTIDPTQTIRQIIYLRSFWCPLPGRTYVEPTQIDAVMMYAFLTPPTGIRCDGSAMVTYRWKDFGKELKVVIESGTLVPRYRMGDAVEPFGPARMTGEVTVYENPGQVVKARQFLETQFSERLGGQAMRPLFQDDPLQLVWSEPGPGTPVPLK